MVSGGGQPPKHGKNWEVDNIIKGRLLCPGSTNPKTSRALLLYKRLPNAKFPNNNHSEIIHRILSERPFEDGIVLCPSNDISNIAQIQPNNLPSIAELEIDVSSLTP